MVFYVSVSFILVLGKNFGRFYEMGSSKSKSLNGLIMVIFKYLALFYAHYPVFFIRTMWRSSTNCEYTIKSLIPQLWI